MTELRRRFGAVFRAPTPDTKSAVAVGQDDTDDKQTKEVAQAVPSSKIQESAPIKRRSKRRNGFIFGLGGIFGIFVALFFANQNQVISLDALMDLNLDALIDVIPAGIVKDANEFSVRSALISMKWMLAALDN